ncbi:MAG: hypothetical protein II776_00930 [Clostridia bacterium]|nr:hypothetical protein [Clostridia bacterium]
MKRRKFCPLALLLAAVLCLSCAAPRASIIGSWKGAVEEKDRFDRAFRAAGLGNELRVDSFPLPVTITFYPDGTYEKSVDPAAVETLLADTRAALRLQWDAMIDARAAEAGLSREAFLKLFDRDPDELFRGLVDEQAVLDEAAALCCRGRYLLRGDRLHLSASVDKAVDEDVYERCELSADTLTLTQPIGPGREGETARYPVTFTRES